MSCSLRGVFYSIPPTYCAIAGDAVRPAVTLRITLSARGDDQTAVDTLLTPPTAELLEKIAAAGFAIRLEETA